MKNILPVLGVVVLLLLGGLFWLVSQQSTIFALCATDYEIVFVVRDALSSKPISGARVQLEIDAERGDKQAIRTELVTDSNGRATYIREDAMCEDVIRPLRKTRTLFDLTWCTYKVSCTGYSPFPETWLAGSKFEERPCVREKRCHRLEFPVYLQKLEP